MSNYPDTSDWPAEQHIERLRKICGTWRVVGKMADAQLVEDAAKFMMKQEARVKALELANSNMELAITELNSRNLDVERLEAKLALQTDWMCHNGGLLAAWAREWKPGEGSLTSRIRDKLDIALAEYKAKGLPVYRSIEEIPVDRALRPIFTLWGKPIDPKDRKKTGD